MLSEIKTLFYIIELIYVLSVIINYSFYPNFCKHAKEKEDIYTDLDCELMKTNLFKFIFIFAPITNTVVCLKLLNLKYWDFKISIQKRKIEKLEKTLAKMTGGTRNEP